MAHFRLGHSHYKTRSQNAILNRKSSSTVENVCMQSVRAVRKFQSKKQAIKKKSGLNWLKTCHLLMLNAFIL